MIDWSFIKPAWFFKYDWMRGEKKANWEIDKLRMCDILEFRSLLYSNDHINSVGKTINFSWNSSSHDYSINYNVNERFNNILIFIEDYLI
jgi:hypothetical protein